MSTVRHPPLEIWIAFWKHSPAEGVGPFLSQDDAFEEIRRRRTSGRTLRYLVDRSMLFKSEGGTLE